MVKNKRRPNGFFSGMSYGEMVEFIRDEGLVGLSLSEFRDSSNSSRAYTVARKNGWINRLVEGEVLVRYRRSRGFFARMSDDEFIKYVFENHNLKKIKEFQKDGTADSFARKTGLLNILVDKGILIRECRRNLFHDMSDNEFIRYVNENHKGRCIRELSKDDPGCYDVARNRGLITRLVDDGILTRKIKVITQELKERIINLLQETAMTYKQIAMVNNISKSSLSIVAKKAIADGRLDPEYRRPDGRLYLENVRRDNAKMLEEVLVGELGNG